MKDFIEGQKVEILISALEERYEALRAIRERVQSVGIWALGILFAAGAWLMQSDVSLSAFQKELLVIAVAVMYVALRYNYLENLSVGFKSQQRVAARLEKTLGLFTQGVFDDEKDSVYPAEWANAGTEKGDGKFFGTTYMLLLIGTIFLIVAILLSGSHVYHFSRFWY